LETFLLSIIQRLFGMETLPIRLSEIAFHSLLAWLIFVSMVKWGFTSLQAIIASLFMLCSQANAMAVLSNDTFSQISGAFFGSLTLLLLSESFWIAETAGSLNPARQLRIYVFSIFAFSLSLLSKETSISFFLAVFFLILLKNCKARVWSTASIHTVIQFAPFLLVTALYFAQRNFLRLRGPRWGRNGYDIHVGLNIVKNFCMFIFEAFVPASSVRVFTATMTGDLPILCMAILGWLTFVLAVGYGVWHSKRIGLLSLIGAFAVLALFPAILMNQVSELYVYNAMPFLSIIAGAGLGALIHKSSGKAWKRLVTIMVLMALLATNVIAIQNKAAMMKLNGDRAATLLGAIEPYLKDIPKNGKLLLLNPRSDEPEYSVFIMNGFNVLDLAVHYVQYIAQRKDFRFEIVQESEFQADQLQSGAVVLALDKRTGQIYRWQ
jgi:hypothetical protein